MSRTHCPSALAHFATETLIIDVFASTISISGDYSQSLGNWRGQRTTLSARRWDEDGIVLAAGDAAPVYEKHESCRRHGLNDLGHPRHHPRSAHVRNWFENTRAQRHRLLFDCLGCYFGSPGGTSPGISGRMLCCYSADRPRPRDGSSTGFATRQQAGCSAPDR